MGLFSKIAEGLKKTKDSFLGGLQRVFNSFTKIDEELFEELEEQMIMSDIGVETSVEICERVRKLVKERGITDPNDIMELIHEVISDIMGDDTGLDLSVSTSALLPNAWSALASVCSAATLSVRSRIRPWVLECTPASAAWSSPLKTAS